MSEFWQYLGRSIGRRHTRPRGAGAPVATEASAVVVRDDTGHGVGCLLPPDGGAAAQLEPGRPVAGAHPVYSGRVPTASLAPGQPKVTSTAAIVDSDAPPHGRRTPHRPCHSRRSSRTQSRTREPCPVRGRASRWSRSASQKQASTGSFLLHRVLERGRHSPDSCRRALPADGRRRHRARRHNRPLLRAGPLSAWPAGRRKSLRAEPGLLPGRRARLKKRGSR